MVYDPQQQPVERIHHRRTMPETYNTCLMVTKREDAIFTLWWEKLVWLTHDYNANRERYDLDYSNLDYRKLEELSFDLLSTEVNIYNIPNSIFGETYTRLNEMTDEEFQHVCFHHYHIYPRLSQYNWVKDIREWNARL